jgi:hypothetical protein
MKTVNNLLEPISKSNMQALVKTVTETVATKNQLTSHKPVFGVADLWNIQRSAKSRRVRSYLL